MLDIFDRPSFVLVTVAIALWLVARLGALARKRFPLDDHLRNDFSILLGASLTLLALIIGFSFSFASNRYDQRKTLEEAEANAIGTEFARAALLPGEDAAKVQKLLRTYVDIRVAFYQRSDEEALRKIGVQTTKLQNELWALIVGPTTAAQNSVMALVAAGMNDVLNSQSYTQAAWWNRIPGSTWAFMVSVATCCSFLIGYGMQSAQSEIRLLFIFPFLVALALAFIADIDSPRHGVIRIQPQNLINLAASLAQT